MKDKFAIWLLVILLVGLIGSVVVKEFRNKELSSSQENLNKYSSLKIPEECRLPNGQSLQSWTEHLGHHENTRYCLEYYKK